jgi:hypothetical protein
MTDVLEPDDVRQAVEQDVDLDHGEVDPLLVAWAHFRDQFAEAMKDGFWSIEDLEQKIASHRSFFFPGKNSALIGEVVVYPTGKKVFQTSWAVGELDELVAMAPGIEAVVRMMGCEGVLIEGDEGWKKALADLGYKPWSVTLYKAL